MFFLLFGHLLAWKIKSTNNALSKSVFCWFLSVWFSISLMEKRKKIMGTWQLLIRSLLSHNLFYHTFFYRDFIEKKSTNNQSSTASEISWIKLLQKLNPIISYPCFVLPSSGTGFPWVCRTPGNLPWTLCCCRIWPWLLLDWFWRGR